MADISFDALEKKLLEKESKKPEPKQERKKACWAYAAYSRSSPLMC
jgi:hypothetical protein